MQDVSSGIKDTLRAGMEDSDSARYITHRIRPVSGHQYALSVEVDGNRYTASSVMPDTVTFKGVTLLSEAGKLSEKSIVTVVPRYQDPAGVKNYYRFEQYVNLKKDPGVNVLTDNIGDGLLNERPIFTSSIDIHPGDTLEVVMIQITKPIYDYFYQLQLNQDELGATPTNPPSNIVGPAPVLGYFSAEYRQHFVTQLSLATK